MRQLFITTLFFLGLMGNTSFAQGAMPGTAGPGSIFNDTMLVRITRRLRLTPEQQPQVMAIISSYTADLVDNPPTSPEEKRTRKRAARKQVMALLTPEQQARLKARRTGRDGRGNAGPEKIHWMDSLLDKLATPLLDHRQRGNGG